MVKMTICKIFGIIFSLCIYITGFYCIIANNLPVFNMASSLVKIQLVKFQPISIQNTLKFVFENRIMLILPLF